MRARFQSTARSRSWKTSSQGHGLDLPGLLASNSAIWVNTRYRRYSFRLSCFTITTIFGQTPRHRLTKSYVVQTNSKVIERCILMTTDPGDLVLDPTCGSGTTAYVAEQWGRRWITIDTSRVALALARARIMGARYPYYILADSRDGQLKEAEVSPPRPVGDAHLRQRPAGVRLRAGAAHHPAGHRQQRRDRRHLRGVPGEAGAAAGGAEPGAGDRRGRSGRFPGRPTSRGRRRRRNCTGSGGSCASPGRGR